MVLQIKVKIDNVIYDIPYESNISHLIMIYNRLHEIKISKLFNLHGKSLLDGIPIRGFCTLYSNLII